VSVGGLALNGSRRGRSRPILLCGNLFIYGQFVASERCVLLCTRGVPAVRHDCLIRGGVWRTLVVGLGNGIELRAGDEEGRVVQSS
jgi:hypothetical protein